MGFQPRHNGDQERRKNETPYTPIQYEMTMYSKQAMRVSAKTNCAPMARPHTSGTRTGGYTGGQNAANGVKSIAGQNALRRQRRSLVGKLLSSALANYLEETNKAVDLSSSSEECPKCHCHHCKCSGHCKCDGTSLLQL